jgi:hypothetical protein
VVSQFPGQGGRSKHLAWLPSAANLVTAQLALLFPFEAGECLWS